MLENNKSENQNTHKKQENWLDDLMERQEHDLEEEEEFLSRVPNRIKHKYLEENEE